MQFWRYPKLKFTAVDPVSKRGRHGFSRRSQVRDHVVHIHIKDATWNPARKDADYNWPGEGQGRVRDILQDALNRGYEGGISIEPHMVVVFHDAGSKSNDDVMRANFVEYGRRLETLLRALGTAMPAAD